MIEEHNPVYHYLTNLSPTRISTLQTKPVTATWNCQCVDQNEAGERIPNADSVTLQADGHFSNMLWVTTAHETDNAEFSVLLNPRQAVELALSILGHFNIPAPVLPACITVTELT